MSLPLLLGVPLDGGTATSLALEVDVPVADAPVATNWESLRGVLAAAAADYAAEVDADPVACPIDGEPLRVSVSGVTFCPFDGWRPGGWR